MRDGTCGWLVLTAALIANGSLGCATTQGPPAAPEVLAGALLTEAIDALQPDGRLTYSGVAFRIGRLYAGTNVGLLEIANGKAVALHRWGRRSQWGPMDYVVEGPMADPTRRALWVWHASTSWLSRLDEAGWHIVPIPFPRGGVMRRDMLQGFHVIGGQQAPHLVGARAAWRWDTGAGRWVELGDIPGTSISGGVVGVALLPDVTAFVVCPQRPVIDGPALHEIVFVRDGGWCRVALGPVHFKQVVCVGGTAFIRTGDGQILAWPRSGVSAIPAPGSCEALAVDPRGRLVAAFTGAGVHRREGDEWTRLFLYPDGPAGRWRWAYLAADDAAIALARCGLHEASTLDLWNGTSVRRIDPRAR